VKCKDCKYFRRDGKGKHDCVNPKFVEYATGEPPKKDELVYWDYEGYAAGFWVGEEFGCIHYVKR